MSQTVGPSEMERAAAQWQEAVLPGAVGAGVRRLVGSRAWCKALGNPWCRSGFDQEQPSSSVTAQGLGVSLALALGEGEEHGATAPAGGPWEVHGEHRVGSPCAWEGVRLLACTSMRVFTRIKVRLDVCACV